MRFTHLLAIPVLLVAPWVAADDLPPHTENHSQPFQEAIRRWKYPNPIPVSELGGTARYDGREISLQTSRVKLYVNYYGIKVEGELVRDENFYFQTEADAKRAAANVKFNAALRKSISPPRLSGRVWPVNLYEPVGTLRVESYLDQEASVPCATRQWQALDTALSALKDAPSQREFLFDTLKIKEIAVTVADRRDEVAAVAAIPASMLIIEGDGTFRVVPFLSKNKCIVASQEEILAFIQAEQEKFMQTKILLPNPAPYLRNIEATLGGTSMVDAKVADQVSKNRRLTLEGRDELVSNEIGVSPGTAATKAD
ncbi:MAG: hypothetical protein AB7P04_12025 [Bacteriovoracia bacterium]